MLLFVEVSVHADTQSHATESRMQLHDIRIVELGLVFDIEFGVSCVFVCVCGCAHVVHKVCIA